MGDTVKMDLATLRYFCAVAREGSVSRAAKKLSYAQSNLSQRIRQMEEELQTPLLRRLSRGVALTGQGETLYRYAERIVKLAEEAENAVRIGQASKGSLRIGSMESAAVSFLPGLLARFHSLHPGIGIEVRTGVSERSLRLVLDGELDGAFVAGPTGHPDIAAVDVLQERLVLLSGQDARPDVPVRDLLRLPLLVLPRGCFYRKLLERWQEDEDIAGAQIMEFDSLGAIVASISAGLGVGFIPASAVASFTAGGLLQIHEAPGRYGIVPVRFAWRGDRRMDSGLRAFVELAGQGVAKASCPQPASPAHVSFPSDPTVHS